ncbi:MAG: metallophosphoesterase family protein [Chthoniobacterales bacterium]|nr:metallophosphoesterase family protein [Chthoniobacterales bacterium]
MHRSPLAVLSDIHSNLHALDAVIAELDAADIDNVVCLGDVVGYAAFPDECIHRIRERGWPTLLGNHDIALDNPSAKAQMNDVANAGIRFAEKNVSAENRQWLEGLPMKYHRTHTIFTHASLDASEDWPYLIDVESALLHFLAQKIPLCFVGHTHRPMIIHWQRAAKLDVLVPNEDPQNLVKTGKTTINVGSVGQPRDGDSRASYVLYFPATHHVEFRRVDYDVKAAQSAIRKAGLPAFSAKRLEQGV